MAPPQAPAATPQIDLQTLPRQIIGRNNAGGKLVAATSRVIPKSTIMSAKSLHLFMSDLNREAATQVKRRFAAIPQPSRTMKFINADNAVAPSRPTPTPSNTRCVARTPLNCVDKSWVQDHIEKGRYPTGVLEGYPAGRNVDLIAALIDAMLFGEVETPAFLLSFVVLGVLSKENVFDIPPSLFVDRTLTICSGERCCIARHATLPMKRKQKNILAIILHTRTPHT
mmetsp:Transcript_13972/g.21789  ORF Transcript_13972/g.21789 Transcript_13972/m.21789 type:complete len:226 (-) Transcript_13972:62-739(-)